MFTGATEEQGAGGEHASTGRRNEEDGRAALSDDTEGGS